jgi:hypothetical protein
MSLYLIEGPRLIDMLANSPTRVICIRSQERIPRSPIRTDRPFYQFFSPTRFEEHTVTQTLTFRTVVEAFIDFDPKVGIGKRLRNYTTGTKLFNSLFAQTDRRSRHICLLDSSPFFSSLTPSQGPAGLTVVYSSQLYSK